MPTLALHSTYSYTYITVILNHNSNVSFFFEMAIASENFSKKNVVYHCQGTEKFELRKQLGHLSQAGDEEDTASHHSSTSVQLTSTSLHLPSSYLL